MRLLGGLNNYHVEQISRHPSIQVFVGGLGQFLDNLSKKIYHQHGDSLSGHIRDLFCPYNLIFCMRILGGLNHYQVEPQLSLS